jgi:hypothetical protein
MADEQDNKGKRFDDETIKEIRAKRAEVDEETGKPVYTHGALAKEFGTSAGRISHIVRNMTYKDPDYTPVNDTVKE